MPLPDEIESLIAPILKALSGKLLADVTGHAVLAYIQGSAQMTSFAGLPYEGPPIQKAIDYAKDHCAQLVTGMDEETKTRLADIISKGIEGKRGVPGLSRDIRIEFADMTKKRSDIIASTECLPGETLVDGAVVRAIHRRWYSGPMVEVITAGGRKFSATPNHPMFTSRGWLPSGEISKGDNLVCYRRQQNSRAPGNKNIQTPPTTLGQIFNSASAVSIRKWKFGTVPDFHGDGQQGKVDILYPYWALRIGVFTPLYEPVLHKVLSLANMSRAPICSRCRRLLPISKKHCFCGTSDVRSSFGESIEYNAVTNTKPLGDAMGRFSSLIGGHNHIRSYVVPITRTPDASNYAISSSFGRGAHGVCLMENSADSVFASRKHFSNLRPSEARTIELDNVISVRVVEFSGHVYNLSTPYGYYTIDEGIITGNTNDALEQAFMDRAEDLSIDGKEWVTAEDEIVCPICGGNADDGVIPLNDMFSGGMLRPPAHPGCLLPDVRVEASHIIAGSRSFYRGKAVEIRTENGNVLSITPNHMILTPFGFVKAKMLHEGDYIMHSLNAERIVSSIDPDNYYRPTRIADIWDSLEKKSTVRNIRTIPSDSFHGDGSKLSNIQVIVAHNDSYCNYKTDEIIEHYLVDECHLNSLELYGLMTFLLEEQGHGKVGKYLYPFDISRTNQQFQQKDREYLPFSHGKIQESLISVYGKNHYLCADYEQYRNCGEGVLSDSVLFGGVSESGHSESLTIPDDVQRSLVGAGARSKHHIGATSDIWHQGDCKQCKLPYNYYTNWQSQERIEEQRGYPKLARGFLERYGSQIAGDKITKIQYFNYSGHVYDLQSLERLYIGNGIVVKNCRCALAPARLPKE